MAHTPKVLAHLKQLRNRIEEAEDAVSESEARMKETQFEYDRCVSNWRSWQRDLAELQAELALFEEALASEPGNADEG